MKTLLEILIEILLLEGNDFCEAVEERKEEIMQASQDAEWNENFLLLIDFEAFNVPLMREVDWEDVRFFFAEKITELKGADFEKKLQKMLIQASFLHNLSVFVRTSRCEDTMYGPNWLKRLDTIGKVASGPNAELISQVSDAQFAGKPLEKVGFAQKALAKDFIDISLQNPELVKQDAALWAEVLALIYPQVEDKLKKSLSSIADKQTFSYPVMGRLRQIIPGVGL